MREAEVGQVGEYSWTIIVVQRVAGGLVVSMLGYSVQRVVRVLDAALLGFAVSKLCGRNDDSCYGFAVSKLCGRIKTLAMAVPRQRCADVLGR